jgi:hypothetical protein
MVMVSSLPGALDFKPVTSAMARVMILSGSLRQKPLTINRLDKALDFRRIDA